MPQNIIVRTSAGNANSAFSIQGSTNGHLINQSRKTKRVTLTCVLIALVFTLTSFPLGILTLLAAAGQRRLASVLDEKFLSLRALNACIDPIFYGLMWRPFRKSLMQVCFCATYGELDEKRKTYSHAEVNYAGYYTLLLFMTVRTSCISWTPFSVETSVFTCKRCDLALNKFAHVAMQPAE